MGEVFFGANDDVKTSTMVQKQEDFHTKHAQKVAKLIRQTFKYQKNIRRNFFEGKIFFFLKSFIFEIRVSKFSQWVKFIFLE